MYIAGEKVRVIQCIAQELIERVPAEDVFELTCDAKSRDPRAIRTEIFNPDPSHLRFHGSGQIAPEQRWPRSTSNQFGIQTESRSDHDSSTPVLTVCPQQRPDVPDMRLT
jgi:hypothetical protein